MSDFALDITNWVIKAKGNVNAVIRKVAFDMGARIIMRTPVDTGRARGNWLLGLGSPQFYSARADKHKTPVNDQGRGQSSAKDSLLNGLQAFEATSGQSIFITNSVPYIGKLEYGSSKQAPAGMVRITVAEFKQIAEQAARNVRGA